MTNYLDIARAFIEKVTRIKEAWRKPGLELDPSRRITVAAINAEGWVNWSCPYCGWRPERFGYWKREAFPSEMNGGDVLIPYACAKCGERYTIKVYAKIYTEQDGMRPTTRRG